jgi:hypothetical protein
MYKTNPTLKKFRFTKEIKDEEIYETALDWWSYSAV